MTLPEQIALTAAWLRRAYIGCWVLGIALLAVCAVAQLEKL